MLVYQVADFQSISKNGSDKQCTFMFIREFHHFLIENTTIIMLFIFYFYLLHNMIHNLKTINDEHE